MAKKHNDTDYLSISTRVRALETRLIRRERLEQILEAGSDDEAAKLLQDSGYPGVDPANPEQMDAALAAVRRETLEELAGGMPDERYLDLFRLKYDYHNSKALLKAAAMNVSPDRMLMDMGTVPADQLRRAVEEDELDGLPAPLAAAVREGKSVLDETRDPQLADMALDSRYYQQLLALAEETGSAFLKGYVQLQIDAANLRIWVRTQRMGKGVGFLRNALFAGGTLAPDRLVDAAEGGKELETVYLATPLQDAAAAGQQACAGGALTEFEKLCDDAVSQYLEKARFVPFGEAPLLGYLAARETEYANLRIVLMGRTSGLPKDVILSRLRASYV